MKAFRYNSGSIPDTLEAARTAIMREFAQIAANLAWVSELLEDAGGAVATSKVLGNRELYTEVSTTVVEVTVTLPPIVYEILGKTFTVIRVTAGANNAIITPSGGNTINGGGSITLTAQWAVRQLRATANGWRVVASA